MKNITLSAEGSLIEEAREVARSRKTTLNQLFRDWLGELAARDERERRTAELMQRLDYVRADGPFTREEMIGALRVRDPFR